VQTAVTDNPVAGGSAGSHDGLLYRTSKEYVDGVAAFLQPGLHAREPVFVSVPEQNCELLRTHLPESGAGVEFADMTIVGHNPNLIIPAIQQFLDAHAGRRVTFVGEPIWAGRSPAEICEATRHEAMLNTVFADVAVDILCPYDVAGLAAKTVADAWRTHPVIVDGNARCASAGYGDPASMYAATDPLQPVAPDAAEVLPIRPGELPWLRDEVRRHSAAHGLSAERTRDLVLAVNEIAVNTLMHTASPGTLRVWREPNSVTCEIRDSGHIVDPLAGRRRPAIDASRGRGLWMANQLCDLVQIRSGEGGTTVRLHVDLNG
jgi:anti-sigma regulatory factor (Ser/Thr protein kinase)